jgi:hypothetical protein
LARTGGIHSVEIINVFSIVANSQQKAIAPLLILIGKGLEQGLRGISGLHEFFEQKDIVYFHWWIYLNFKYFEYPK